jgi:hypothetical protein
VFREMVLTGLRTIHLPSGQACPIHRVWGRVREILSKIVLSLVGLEICLTGFGLDESVSRPWRTANTWLFYAVVAVSLGTLLNYLRSDLGRIKEAMATPERPGPAAPRAGGRSPGPGL